VGCMGTYHCRTMIIFRDRIVHSGGTVSKIAGLVKW